MIELETDLLKVQIYDNRELMGADAASMVAARINDLLQNKDFVNLIFGAASSQNEFLQSLQKERVDWSRVNAFHMDEYIGLSKDAPQQFGIWLKERIFSKVPFGQVFYLNGQVSDIEAESKRYEELLQQFPPDITCMGIGENTHIAFNDPHVADFNDPHLVKVVGPDDISRQQQVNEGCFDDISQVPKLAWTLTIPALLQADYIYCMVPGPSKAQAVYHTLTADISERYPATILRTHRNAYLFLDKQSGAKILKERNYQP